MKEKINLDTEKIVSNVITGSLLIVISFAIISCLVIVAKPILENKGLNLDSSVSKEGIDRIEEAIEKIKSQYIDIDEVSDEDIVDHAIQGVCEATGDPYTRYLTEEEYQEVLTSGNEVYGGIGVHINFDKEKNGILVLGVMPNSPAIEVGVKAGDVIIKVAGETVTKDNYSACIDNIKGEQGTKASIVIKRNDELFEMEIERKQIATYNIESEVIDNNIGYIKIWAFENNIYKQFKEEYDKLMSKSISGLVIDLRNNPGGLVPETINIAKLFLPKGDILKLVYNTGKEKIYKDDDGSEINIPLTVLVNSRSASASEILSGAIKDLGKGAIIGNKTYGKGIVQTIEKLGNRGALSITTSKYYTASGIEIHKNGIEPNISIDLPKEYENNITIPREQDTQLKRAIEYIKTGK